MVVLLLMLLMLLLLVLLLAVLLLLLLVVVLLVELLLTVLVLLLVLLLLVLVLHLLLLLLLLLLLVPLVVLLPVLFGDFLGSYFASPPQEPSMDCAAWSPLRVRLEGHQVFFGLFGGALGLSVASFRLCGGYFGSHGEHSGPLGAKSEAIDQRDGDSSWWSPPGAPERALAVVMGLSRAALGRSWDRLGAFSGLCWGLLGRP